MSSDNGPQAHEESEHEDTERVKRPSISLFRRNTIAFAPSDLLLLKEKEERTSLQTHHVDSKDHVHDSQKPGQPHPETKSKSISRPGKVPLPRPYKTHWAEIESRRAKRDFIYGRDEEYMFPERDIRVKTPCSGVLVFHIIELLDLTVNRQSFLETVPVSFYCLLSIGSIKRCTKIVHASESRQIRMDSHVHLSIDVSEWREAPGNRLRLELWSFQDPEAHFIVGTMEIHMYNFIRIQHKIDTVHLWSDGIKVGKLAYEVAFSYGAFGYGHSNQLKNFSQPIMETVSHSMFPRIKLDEKSDISDASFQARKPEKLKLFTYHSLILEVDERIPHISAFFGRSKDPNRSTIDLEPKPMVVQQVEFEQGFPVHAKLHMNIWQKIIQPDFNDMYGEYVCIGHKRERLDYLTNMVQGRMRDVFEEEAGPIFEFLKPKELDQIHRSDNGPGEMLYPSRIQCPYSEPYTLLSGDEAFFDKFPTVRRVTGYLSTFFGYDKKPPPEEFLNQMDYPAFKDVKITQAKVISVKHFKQWFLNWAEATYYRGKAKMIQIFYYIFPEVKEELPIPEVSVTIATPEGSTTNIYSYFAREPKDQSANTSKVDRLVRQTTALIDMTKRNQNQGKTNPNESDSDDSSDENVEQSAPAPAT